MRYVEVRGKKITEEHMKKLYNLYLENIIKFCSALEVEEITVDDKDIWRHHDTLNYNPYLNTTRKALVELGTEIYIHGMYWIFTVNDTKLFEGRHRYASLKYLSDSGVLPKDTKYLAVNLDKELKHDIEIKSVYDEMDYYEEDYEDKLRTTIFKKGNKNNHPIYVEIVKVPQVFRNMTYRWKEKYGEVYPPALICNDYDALMSEIDKITKK